MPDPGELGAVFWSAAAQQFYQEGRVGALPRLEGLERLSVVETPTGLRYQDELGQFMPRIADLIPQSQQFHYVEALRTARPTSADVYADGPPENSYYATGFTFRDPEGHVRWGFLQNRVGRTIDDEEERSRIIASIGARLDIDESSPEGGSDILSLAFDEMFHFVVR